MRIMQALSVKVFAQQVTGVNADGTLSAGDLEPSWIDNWVKGIEVEHPMHEDDTFFLAPDLDPVAVHDVTHQFEDDSDTDHLVCVVSTCMMVEAVNYAEVIQPRLEAAGWHLDDHIEVDPDDDVDVQNAPIIDYALNNQPSTEAAAIFPPSFMRMALGAEERDSVRMFLDLFAGLGYAISDDCEQNGDWASNPVKAFIYCVIHGGLTDEQFAYLANGHGWDRARVAEIKEAMKFVHDIVQQYSGAPA